MMFAGKIFALILAMLVLLGVVRALVALQQGKRRKSFYFAYLAGWVLLFAAMFDWFFILHWQRFSGVYCALLCLAKAAMTGLDYRWRKSIPDAEW